MEYSILIGLLANIKVIQGSQVFSWSEHSVESTFFQRNKLSKAFVIWKWKSRVELTECFNLTMLKL